MAGNQSKRARITRVAVGLVLLSLMFIGPRTLWGLVGIIPLLAGLTGFDPLYRMLGVSTRGGPVRPSESH